MRGCGLSWRYDAVDNLFDQFIGIDFIGLCFMCKDDTVSQNEWGQEFDIIRDDIASFLKESVDL
jgi:hypothetical protein